MLFEVRIPTYNRPDLLRRALESLRSQTYPHWMATVYDDATSAGEVVLDASDNRIGYVRNRQKLGICNIDQRFSPTPSCGGDYACLLEDDNFWLPEFLAHVANQLKIKPHQLVQVNQRIWSEKRGLHPATETTRGQWLSAGMVDPIQLRAALLFMRGLSQGGIIWKLDGTQDLRVGRGLQNFGLQELCRGLLVKSPFLFIDTPLAVFNFMPKAETARSGDDNRSFGRGMQSIRSFIIRHSSPEVIRAAMSLAEKNGSKRLLYELMVHSGHFLPGWRLMKCVYIG